MVLFELARRLKDIRREIDAVTLDEIAGDWFTRMGAAMGEVDVCEVRSLLKNAFAKARYGLTEPTLKGEHERRKAEPRSETAKRFRNPRLRDAVCVLEAAQRLNPNGDFAMSGERLGERIGCTQAQAAKHLRSLCEANVIEVTADFEFKKRARRYRLVGMAKAVVVSVAEKVRGLLAAVSKLFAGVVGKATAASEPTPPAKPDEPTEPQAESERAWHEADPNQEPYDPNKYKPTVTTSRARDETHKRDWPKKLRWWPKLTPMEEIQQECIDERKKPARVEPEPI